MSADKQQDYFSDGLSEELLDSLAKVHDLQVAARTSSFSFKGEKVEIADIARKLNVGAILEGSVRRDGNHVRITAQLINALTGFHLWSETYDRDLKNVFALQTEIATAVTGALQATLLPGAVAAIDTGGTQNAAALDAYLRGKTLVRDDFIQQREEAALAAFESAIKLDPNFAKAYASFAIETVSYSNNFVIEGDLPKYGQRARSAALKAVELAPDLGESHLAMAYVMERIDLDFAGATREYARAQELSPNDAEVLAKSGAFYLEIGPRDRGLSNIRRALALDPLNARIWGYTANFTEAAGEFAEATKEIDHALALNPNNSIAHMLRGLLALDQGDPERAIAICTEPKPSWQSLLCLALSYDKIHKRSESDAQIAAMLATLGNSSAYQFAEIYAQRGDIPKAVEWLETAYRLRDPGLISLRTDRWLEPLRQTPRYLEIERKLFPQS
jgi:TolB-like protein